MNSTLSGKPCLVAGLGESGLAIAKWLCRQGAEVVVVDSRAHPPGVAALAAAAPGVEVVCGAFPPERFLAADVVAISPGIDPKILPPGKRPPVSEVDLFMAAKAAFAPDSRILAITGSNGKTTTTALTAHLLNGAGIAAVACGNISPSLLDAFMAAQDAGVFPKVWVLELSSFQLESTRSFAADAAVVLNVSEDHLDRHGDMSAYGAAKRKIYAGASVQVFNRDDAFINAPEAATAAASALSFGLGAPPADNAYGVVEGWICKGETPLVARSELPLAGLHNAANLMAALALGAGIGVAPQTLLRSLASFRGLPHRVEKVAEIDGVLYVDDSKGTNVGATLAAIEGMGRPVAIVLGGDGKGQDFSPLRAALAAHGRAVALIGKDADAIAATLAGLTLPVKRFASLPEATHWLADKAKKGDCVLLSPACASWDMFRDYKHRAEVFIAAVAGRADARQGESA